MEPAASEACRLLCAGVYLDPRFRDTVLDELYVHEERFVAPSVGFDAARVLAHAVRARRMELGWALGTVALLVVALLITGWAFLLVAVPSLFLALTAVVTGPRVMTALAYGVEWILLTGIVVLLVVRSFADDPGPYAGSEQGSEFGPGSGSGPGGMDDPLDAFLGPSQARLTLLMLALVAVGVGIRRGVLARVLAVELSTHHFPSVASDPAITTAGSRLRRLSGRIRAEQHEPLVMYHSANPFLGVGVPRRPWTLAVELRPQSGREPSAVGNAEVLRLILPLLEELRASAAHTVRDRLRELTVDECVFLPADGLQRRDGAPFHPSGIAEHHADSVEEGGEARRHFLRIKVGGWQEELVVTVFVRVHTQGGMLMLEVAPHVLRPVRERFREGDGLAHRFRSNFWFGKLGWALRHAPAAVGESLVAVVRYLLAEWRRLAGGYGDALPEGPAVSVRELGSGEGASLFQEMDANRYLTSIQDRVTGGVRQALYEAGWQTAEFEQKIVNVSEGGVFIDSVRDSALAVGDHNEVRTGNTTTRASTSDSDRAGDSHGRV
ncbi:hypothetical protein DVH02_23370 [Streptomyces corynorhini]|uniref:Uncharacterized protein n=1 Tax=Streptomyces corynorhini TaxID=2282652 RepID=A0A370B8T5_9ACTN|nr:hypothetical protein DVH02_23370 [Streptomyces corynorhini]